MSLYKARKLLESEGLYLVEDTSKVFGELNDEQEQKIINARKAAVKPFFDALAQFYRTANRSANTGYIDERLQAEFKGRYGQSEDGNGTNSTLWDVYKFWGDKDPKKIAATSVITAKLRNKEIQFENIQEMVNYIKENLVPEDYKTIGR